MANSTRNKAASRFRNRIGDANELHARYLDDPVLIQDYERFTTWQLEHLLPFFKDLYEQDGYDKAIEFTMSDLAGVGISNRDRDLERAAPAITRMLPLRALETLADAADANARVLKINIAICSALRVGDKLPNPITEVDYCVACREASDLGELTELVHVVCGLGRSLKSLVRIPLIGMTLAAMRMPAKAAGFAALHDFLENGYLIFRKIPDIDHFIAEIESRMIDVFTLIYTFPLQELRRRTISNEDIAALRAGRKITRTDS